MDQNSRIMVNFKEIPSIIRKDLDLPAQRGRISVDNIREWVETHPTEVAQIAKALNLSRSSNGRLSRPTREKIVELISSPQARGDAPPRPPRLSIVRLWAIENGYNISPTTGRIPEEVKQAFIKAHTKTPRQRRKRRADADKGSG